jgi:succinate dehydrogenase/fumarate reductase flavoprotein subunit
VVDKGVQEPRITQVPIQWTREADVVIVGYGGAGAAAAITAREGLGTVILLEKAAGAGGNTRTSSGGMRIPEDSEKAAQYIKAIGLGSIDEETAALYGEMWAELPDWFARHGAPLRYMNHPGRWNVAGVDTFQKIGEVASHDGYIIGCGRDLFSFLDETARNLGVEVMLNTPARRLVQEPATREIVGVMALRGEQEIAIKANKAVIMTCGGFEGNREMLATYVEAAPVPIFVSGTPYNTGDGIKMVLDIGADLWHMNNIEWGRQGLKVPEFPAAFWVHPLAWSWINVNRYGKRFRNESDTYAHAKKRLEVFSFDKENTQWPNHPWYMVFDEKTRQAGSIITKGKESGRPPFVTYNFSSDFYENSPDNSKEIEKGWIKKADTWPDLAGRMGIDAVGLQDTIAVYNRNCSKTDASDPDFQRNPKTMDPIDTPPYYAIECAVNVVNTQGGPRRNAKCQVMNPYGSSIPRLYAGGEFGSIWGFLYPGAGNLPECLISGIIAGRQALAEHSRR